MRILIAEDERDLNRLLVKKLTAESYSVDACANGEEALDCLACARYDAVILDIMMPHLDGFSVCRSAREMSNSPIILLTAKSTEDDKLKGYDCGADDYMTKPFSPRILLAKADALLRRSGCAPLKTVNAGSITLQPASQKVWANGREISLTFKEYELLSYLMSNPGQVFGREQLLNHVWGYDFEGTTRTVDTHIKTLRHKLGDAGRSIVTLIRSGYKFEVTP